MARQEWLRDMTIYGRRSSADRLGRHLARRARNRCELCRESTSLNVVEVEPVFVEPDLERAVMICERYANEPWKMRDAVLNQKNFGI